MGLILAIATAALAAPVLRAADVPALDGCEGDPACDAGPGLAELLDQADGVDGAHVDLTGTWYTATPVELRCGADCIVEAGTIRVHDSVTEPLPYVVRVATGQRLEVRGTLRVEGRPTSWLEHRTAVDGVVLDTAVGARIDGIAVRYVRRWGVTTGRSVIGASVGSVWVRMAGSVASSGLHYVVDATTATRIERTGRAASPVQRARVTLDEPLLGVEPGDHVWLGLHLVAVTDVDDAELEVYPWPGALEGGGAWPVEAVYGGGLRVHGSNAAGVDVGSLTAEYVGTGVQLSGLYGAHVGPMMVEVSSVCLQLSAPPNGTVYGATIAGLHCEIADAHVLQSGHSVERAVLLSSSVPVVPGDSYRLLAPTLHDGRSQAGLGAYGYDLGVP